MTQRSDHISLRDYFDKRFDAVEDRFDAQEKAVTAALASAQKAVDKAEAASERRFEGVNEFRAALNDNARLLMPRLEAEQMNKTMNDKIEVLTARLNARDDRGAGLNQGWLYLLAAAGLIGTIWGFLK